MSDDSEASEHSPLADSDIFRIGIPVIVILAIIGISSAEYLSLEIIGSLQAIASIILTGFLVFLYGQQSKFLNSQVGLMETQNKLLMQEYDADISVTGQPKIVEEDRIEWTITNRGAGMAWNVSLKFEIDFNEQSHQAVIPAERDDTNDPKSPGLIDGFSQEIMFFDLELPEISGNRGQRPFSDALEQYRKEGREEIPFSLSIQHSDPSDTEIQAGPILLADTLDLNEVRTASDYFDGS